MKLYKINFLIAIVGIILLEGCSKKELNAPVVTNTNPPGVVSNVKVINLNGQAVLTYTLPSDKDLLYVKAVYEISTGATTQVEVSRYTNTLTVVGFGDTLSHVVKLYAVNSSEVASAPVLITVNPRTPSYILARRTLQVTVTFGGFTLVCQNHMGDNLVIIPMVDTLGNGKWTQTIGMDNVYSNDTAITATIRNQPSVQRNYAFVVRDRWFHYSDTLFVKLTPLFEQMISKSGWGYGVNNLLLPNDAVWAYGTVENLLWDGNFNSSWPSVYFTLENASMPQLCTIDLGSPHIFSRFQINPYMETQNSYYVRGNLKDFEIYGSNSPDFTDPVGPLNTPGPSWTKLATYRVVQPSGSPYGTETTADYNAGHAGWQFTLPSSVTTAYRYVRIRCIDNWQGSYFMEIGEFTMWGQ